MIIIDRHVDSAAKLGGSSGAFSSLSSSARKALGILATNIELNQEFLCLPDKSWELLETTYGCGKIEQQERDLVITLFQIFIRPGSSVALIPQMHCWVDCTSPT